MGGLFLMVCGLSFGLLAAAGVFTVLVAVGIVPRFAGKTHTANKVFLYEEMVTMGTIVGGVASLFPRYCCLNRLESFVPGMAGFLAWLGMGLQVIFGIFGGMFVGCLALAIAEMLDAVPIFARRIGFRHGLGLAVLSIALGKLCGSLYYFWTGLYGVVK